MDNKYPPQPTGVYGGYPNLNGIKRKQYQEGVIYYGFTKDYPYLRLWKRDGVWKIMESRKSSFVRNITHAQIAYTFDNYWFAHSYFLRLHAFSEGK